MPNFGGTQTVTAGACATIVYTLITSPYSYIWQVTYFGTVIATDTTPNGWSGAPSGGGIYLCAPSSATPDTGNYACSWTSGGGGYEATPIAVNPGVTTYLAAMSSKSSLSGNIYVSANVTPTFKAESLLTAVQAQEMAIATSVSSSEYTSVPITQQVWLVSNMSSQSLLSATNQFPNLAGSSALSCAISVTTASSAMSASVAGISSRYIRVSIRDAALEDLAIGAVQFLNTAGQSVQNVGTSTGLSNVCSASPGTTVSILGSTTVHSVTVYINNAAPVQGCPVGFLDAANTISYTNYSSTATISNCLNVGTFGAGGYVLYLGGANIYTQTTTPSPVPDVVVTGPANTTSCTWEFSSYETNGYSGQDIHYGFRNITVNTNSVGVASFSSSNSPSGPVAYCAGDWGAYSAGANVYPSTFPTTTIDTAQNVCNVSVTMMPTSSGYAYLGANAYNFDITSTPFNQRSYVVYESTTDNNVGASETALVEKNVSYGSGGFGTLKTVVTPVTPLPPINWPPVMQGAIVINGYVFSVNLGPSNNVAVNTPAITLSNSFANTPYSASLNLGYYRIVPCYYDTTFTTALGTYNSPWTQSEITGLTYITGQGAQINRDPLITADLFLGLTFNSCKMLITYNDSTTETVYSFGMPQQQHYSQIKSIAISDTVYSNSNLPVEVNNQMPSSYRVYVDNNSAFSTTAPLCPANGSAINSAPVLTVFLLIPKPTPTYTTTPVMKAYMSNGVIVAAYGAFNQTPPANTTVQYAQHPTPLALSTSLANSGWILGPTETIPYPNTVTGAFDNEINVIGKHQVNIADKTNKSLGDKNLWQTPADYDTQKQFIDIQHFPGRKDTTDSAVVFSHKPMTGSPSPLPFTASDQINSFTFSNTVISVIWNLTMTQPQIYVSTDKGNTFTRNA